MDREGKPVEEGQLLVSIETDKTVVEVNSPIGGTVLRIVGTVDKEYQVGDTLAWIGKDDEDIPDQSMSQRHRSRIRAPHRG